MLEKISTCICKINQWIGDKTSWLSLILVILICVDVLFRYIFDHTQTWIIELEWHIFSLMFLFGASYAFLANEHVRVDVYYSRYTKRSKAIFDLIFTLLLLIPWCIVIIKTSFNYGLNSFYMNEGSPNPGGLPARYIIKFSICIGFALLLFQAIAFVLQQFKLIKNQDH
jgi:TRAP-type mannitol/chloroaromatic compound transport system permease small subunit